MTEPYLSQWVKLTSKSVNFFVVVKSLVVNNCFFFGKLSLRSYFSLSNDFLSQFCPLCFIQVIIRRVCY